MKSIHKDQNGLASVVMIVLAVVVVGAIGFTAYRVLNKDKTSSTASDTNKALSEAAQAECDKHNDKDLCKFFTSWKANEKYRMTNTDPSGAKSIFEIDGSKTHMTMSGEMAYEVIMIDKVTYTKAGDIWYKQTAKSNEQTPKAEDVKADLEDPEDESIPEEDRTTYRSLGKEACGSLTCFKYEMIDPDEPDIKTYIWFDDKDYQARRSLTESPEGANDTTFEYENIAVSEPSPVQELGPNQYIVPGQTEPMTMPSAADFNQE